MSRRPARQMSDRRRIVLGVVSALGAHALVALWILTVGPERPAVRASQKIVVQLQPRIAPPRPPPVALPKPEKEPPPRQAAHQRDRTRPPEQAHPEPPAPPAIVTAPPVAGPQNVDRQVVVPVAPPGAQAPKQVNLFPDSLRDRAHDGLGPVAQPSPEESGTPLEVERRRVENRINHELVANQAISRVATGLVDPYFKWLKTRVKRTWLSASDVPDDNDSKSGRAIDPPSEADRVFAVQWDGGDLKLDGGLVVLKLVQTREGSPTHVAVVQSSGSSVLDRTASAALMRAAAASPAPAHGLGLGGKSIESLWRLEAHRPLGYCSYSPSPAATVGPNGDPTVRASTVNCAPFPPFDLTLHGVQADLRPNQVITKVEYVAIYGGEQVPGAAQ